MDITSKHFVHSLMDKWHHHPTPCRRWKCPLSRPLIVYCLYWKQEINVGHNKGLFSSSSPDQAASVLWRCAKEMESPPWGRLAEVYRLAVILVICVMGGVNDKFHHYHYHRRIKSGMALFGKCFHIHAKDNIPLLYQKFELPVLQNKFNKLISLFGKFFQVTLESWIKFTVLFYS